MRRTIALCAYASLLLSACTLVEVTEEPDENTAPIIEEEPVRETDNVTYTGTVQPAGISIYQQGSHRLVLSGGKFILLEADTIDLNGYVNEEVQVFGALRPTVEAGGMIMRVARIELMNSASDSSSSESSLEEVSSSSSDSSEDESSSEESSSSMSSDESSDESNVSESSEATSSAETSSEASESSAESSVESSKTSEPSAAFTENLEVMARQDYSATNWTQQYCSSHVGFCIPVHRNFWFKSFGATETTLWHVEFSSAPVESLGEGPIALELKAGSKTEADGTVEVVDGKVIAYKEWTFGRHFVISADAQLETAVRYMMENITEFTQ